MRDAAGALDRGWHGQPSRLFGRYPMESGFDREYTPGDNYLDARRASHVTGRRFHLYLILDIYSRKIVGHEVHEVESGEQLRARSSGPPWRPRVSDDNACAESLFRTAKYRPGHPAGGFADLDQARRCASHFVHWYNTDQFTVPRPERWTT